MVGGGWGWVIMVGGGMGLGAYSRWGDGVGCLQ